jgi:NAD-dependent histone deacetylase SIR2
VIVAELARRAGWSLNHKMIPEGQEVQVKTINEEDHEQSVRVLNPPLAAVPEPKTEVKTEVPTTAEVKADAVAVSTDKFETQ